MKSFVRIIAVFVALNLATTNFSLAQNAPEEESQKIAQEVEAAAQKKMEAVKQQAEAVVKENVKGALKRTQDELTALQDHLITVRGLRLPRIPWYSGAGTLLVIPTAEIKAEDFVTIMEDMNIMSRIFDKKLQQAHIPVSGGFFSFDRHVWRLFGRDSRATEAIYLQDYGAIFLVKVDFLLSPPPETEKKDEQSQSKEPIDPVWDQTIKELYEPERVSRDQKERPEEKYDAEKVENLKTTFIKALKHAANIRNLKPEESVIITVKGRDHAEPAVFFEAPAPLRASQPQPRNEPASVSRLRGSHQGASRGVYISSSKVTERSLVSSTVLIIRAKKSDIDDFSKDELDFDQFRQRVQIFTQ